MVKDTRLKERLTLQFRAEIFNLLNRANFNTPEPDCVYTIRSVGNGRRHHQHVDDSSPGAVRVEVAVVTG